MRNKLFLMLSLIVSVAFGQTDSEANKVLTAQQNQEWLTDLNKADKETQLSKIKGRFFDYPNEDTEGENIMPLIILEGNPLSITDLTERKREFIKTHLTTDHIQDIRVLDKEAEELYIEKKFTGIIALTFKNKRTAKKWMKFN